MTSQRYSKAWYSYFIFPPNPVQLSHGGLYVIVLGPRANIEGTEEMISFISMNHSSPLQQERNGNLQA